jgi:heme exporter protein C
MKPKIYSLLAVLALLLIAYGTFLALGNGKPESTVSLNKVDASPSPVNLEVDSSAGFVAGGTVVIDSADSGVRETEQVVAVPDATHITVAKLDHIHGVASYFAVINKVPLSRQMTSPAPMERTMGDVQRIFYYHVPAATAGYTMFFINFVASIIYLVRRSPAADRWAATSAEVGLVFATVVLITGPIWGRVAWNTWWAWEPRLTTFLILWLLYVSYLVLRRAAEGASGSVLAAAMAVFAFLDVPFSYMGNRLRGHHPPPITLEDPGMKYALTVNMLAFLLFAGLIAWMRSDLERLARKISDAHIQKASRGAMACIALPALFVFMFQERQNLNPTHFMYAGYIAAWTIYTLYLLFLIAKRSRLKKEAAEVGI